MTTIEHNKKKDTFMIVENFGKKQEIIYKSNNIDNIVSYLNTKYR